MARRAISFGELVTESSDLARHHAFPIVSSIIGMSAINAFLDLNGFLSASLVVNLIIFVFLQYLFTEQLVRDRQVEAAPGRRRYGALLGASLLSGIAIGFAFLLLVIPGIYLSGRWMQSSAQVVAGGKSASDALSASWAATEESQLPHFLAGFLMAFPALTIIVAYVLPLWLDGAVDQIPAELETTSAIIAQSVLNSLVSIIGWVVGIASYRLTDTSAPQAAAFE